MLKHRALKSVTVTLVLGAALLVVSGCGAKTVTNTNPVAATADTSRATAGATTQTDPNLLVTQQQTQSIDSKSTSGEKEIDSQIDKNLNDLDKSLQAMDQSLGSL